jgi:hypothetical protein
VRAAHKDLAAGFDQLRLRQAELRLERPRIPELTQQIADLGILMRDWKTAPPAPDLAEIQAEYDRLAKAADDRLKAEAPTSAAAYVVANRLNRSLPDVCRIRYRRPAIRAG